MHVSKKIISCTILFFVIANIFASPLSYALDTQAQNIISQGKKGNLDISTTAGEVKKTIAKTSLKKLNKGQKKFVPGQILVKFKKNKLNLVGSNGRARLASFSSTKNVRPVKEFARQNTSLLSVTGSETTEQAIKRLKTDTSVEFVQPNYIYSTQTAPNDTYFSDAWGLDNVGQNVLGTTGTPGADVGAIRAWEIFTGATISTGSLIAVIDDGVAYNHSDLVNKMWDGTNCVDKNNVFLGGCVHGYDFINDRKTPLPIRGDTHGTVVAGIIGAQLNNSIGLAGVNPNVRIMAIKAGEEGGLTSAGIIDGMNFAKYNGAKIINASWGMRGLDDTTPYVNNFDYMLYNAIKDFGDSGGLFITSAGNSAMNHESGNMNDRLFPSDFSLNTTLSGGLMLTGLTNIISVAATDKNDALASFSDYGSGSVHIGAPGKGIYSTIITDATGFAEDFSTASTGSVGVFTATGNTLNNWGVAGQKIWTDLPNEPYMSGADTSIEKSINFGSSITSAKFSYKAWCDTPSSASWKDYVRLEFSTGSAWNLVYMFDKDSLSVSGSASSIGLRTGYYETNSLSLPPTYISSDFKFRFRWITDGIDDQDANGYNFGCYIDDISMVTYDDGTGNMYDAYDGTSMAAPFVSGIASLAWGYKQNLTAQEVKDIILSTGTPLASLSDKTISGKRASAYRSLASLASPTVTNLKIYTASGGTEITQSGYTSTTAPYVRWDSPVGQGTMSGYLLSVSSGSGVVYSGTTNATYFSGFTLTQDDAYTLSVVGVNDMGATGSVVAKMFMLDTTSPAIVSTISPTNGQLINTGTIDFSWTASNDSGAGVKDYKLIVWTGSSASGAIQYSASQSKTLTGLNSGDYSWTVQTEDNIGNISNISNTGSFTIDIVGPDAPTNVKLSNNLIGVANHTSIALIGSGNTADSGAVAHYTISSSTSGSISGTGILDGNGIFSISNIDFSPLLDGVITSSAYLMDQAGNMSSTVTLTGVLDTVVPVAPTNITLNGGILIGSGTQGSVVLSGSGAPSESGATISYSVSDGIRSVSGTGTLGNNGSFTINNIDVTSLDDGVLSVSALLVDYVGNTSALGSSTVQKSVFATGEQAIFLSGSSINSFNTQIRLKADKTVSYSITGSELSQSITGSIIGSGSVIENLSFTGSDGQKNITVTFTDLAQVSTSIAKSIIVDTTAPIISVLSHTNNMLVTGSSVTITGTLSDITGISTFSQNMSPVLSFSGNWTMSTTLAGGDNPITFRATDMVGNNSIGNFSLTRIAVSSVSSTVLQNPTSVKVNFTSDLNGTGVVLYGTSSGSLTSTMTGSLTGTSHEVILTDLLADTQYYYQAHTMVAGYSGSLSNVGTFRTPRVVDVSIGSTASATGTIGFSGTTSTGAVFGMNSGSITLISSDSVNSISFSLSGLTISTSGSWNSIIQAPEIYNFTGSVSVDTGYTRTGSVYKIGSDSSPLAFSGQTVNTSIYVGLGLNGKTLRIYRSDDNGTTFANIGSCTVSGGNCVFSTDHFSFFAFAEPVAVVATPAAQSSGGGGGGPVKDSCPNSDTSPSYYDKKCSVDNVTQTISSTTTTVEENNSKASESSFSFSSPLFNTPRLSLKAKKYIDATFIGVIDKRLEAKTEKKPMLRLKNYEALKKYFYKKQLQAKDSKEKQIFRYIQSEFEKKAAKKNG